MWGECSLEALGPDYKEGWSQVHDSGAQMWDSVADRMMMVDN